MTVAVVGGLDRLERHYTALAKEHAGLKIKVYSQLKPRMSEKIASADGVVLVTNVVSHNAAREVYRLARDKGLSIVPCHRASVSAMRECVNALVLDAAREGGTADAPRSS